MHEEVAARAAVTVAPGVVEVVDISVAPPNADEVRVAIVASGVCRTDEELLGHPGLIPGHEGAGIVEAVGNDVEDIEVGDRVLLNWAMSCGSCFYCRRGHKNLCEVGSPLHNGPGSRAHAGSTTYRDGALARAFGLGTLSTMTLVPARAVTRIPDTIPFPSAAILGCAVMTGIGSALNAAHVLAGDTVAVIGIGSVGLNVIQGARLAGATTIIAIGRDPEKLDVARRFGATHVIQFSANAINETADAVRLLTHGRGADSAFECTGVPSLAVAPLALIRHGGVAVQVSGVSGELDVDMSLFAVDKTFVYSLYGECDPARDFPRMFRWYEERSLLLDELVTRSYELDGVRDAFEDLGHGQNIKSVVMMP